MVSASTCKYHPVRQTHKLGTSLKSSRKASSLNFLNDRLNAISDLGRNNLVFNRVYTKSWSLNHAGIFVRMTSRQDDRFSGSRSLMSQISRRHIVPVYIYIYIYIYISS